jgi:bifunctional DNA-binding transcriptional regulator/antitoxin component of YhaV-PrlF toxin-antitoxin module
MTSSVVTISLDEAGRILLPQAVQRQLGVKPGDALALQEGNGHWILKPVTPSIGLCDEELNWEDLDYDSPAPRKAEPVSIRVEHRGKLAPMAYDLDDE